VAALIAISGNVIVSDLRQLGAGIEKAHQTMERRTDARWRAEIGLGSVAADRIPPALRGFAHSNRSAAGALSVLGQRQRFLPDRFDYALRASFIGLPRRPLVAAGIDVKLVLPIWRLGVTLGCWSLPVTHGLRFILMIRRNSATSASV